MSTSAQRCCGFFVCLFCFWLHPGIEPRPSAVKAQSPGNSSAYVWCLKGEGLGRSGAFTSEVAHLPLAHRWSPRLRKEQRGRIAPSRQTGTPRLPLKKEPLWMRPIFLSSWQRAEERVGSGRGEAAPEWSLSRRSHLGDHLHPWEPSCSGSSQIHPEGLERGEP